MKPLDPLDKFLLDHASRSYKAVERGEVARTTIAVTLIRRNRGASFSDSVGEFSTGLVPFWSLDTPAEDLQYNRIRTLNIVKREIRAAVANMITAGSRLKCEAANQDPRLGGGANLLQGLADYFDDDENYWSEVVEDQLAEMAQVNYGAFLKVDYDRRATGLTVTSPQWDEEQFPMPGEYACAQCQTSGPLFADQSELMPHPSGIPRTLCPQCGDSAEVTREPYRETLPIPGQPKQESAGAPLLTVVSPFEIRLDEKNSLAGQIHKAGWFEWHHLMEQEEVEDETGGMQLGAAADWSMPLKWKYALETGVDYYKARNSEASLRLYEIRQHWLSPRCYRNRVEPAPFRLIDGQGKVVFEIGPGERLLDYFPDGLHYWTHGDRLLPRQFAPEDFTHYWSYLGFLPDAHSAWIQPRVELIQLQKDLNRDYTTDRLHREANSRTGIAYDSTYWSADDFEEDLIGSKQEVASVGIEKTFKTWATPPMNEAMTGMAFMFHTILPNIGISQAATLGIQGADQNFSAELLQRQSSLGLLNPYNKSKGRAKIITFRNFARCVQQNWQPEQFKYLMTRLGEEWREEDIEAFLGSDIQRDYRIGIQPGTDVPLTQMEKEIKLANVMEKAASIPSLQQYVTPELVSDYLHSAGINYDIQNIEGETRLASSRYQKIREGLKTLRGRVGTMDVVQLVLAAPEFTPLPDEDHKTGIEFFSDQSVALMCAEVIDQPLIAACMGMIQRHKMAMVGVAQEGVQAQMAAQQPQIDQQQQMMVAQGAQQQQMAGMQAAQEQAQQQAQTDVQLQQQEAQSQETAAQRDFDREQASLDRDHQLELAKVKAGRKK